MIYSGAHTTLLSVADWKKIIAKAGSSMPKFKKNKANIKPVVATSSFPYDEEQRAGCGKYADTMVTMTPTSP